VPGSLSRTARGRRATRAKHAREAGAAGAETKIEIRYEAGQAEVLAEEWVHGP
jgi:hypothetical protein